MLEVHRATPDRVPLLATVLAASFADDPMIRWPFHDHDVVARSRTMWAALLGEYVKHGMVWEAGGGAGAAVWIPPDSSYGLEDMNDTTRPMIAGITDDGGDRYHRFWDWLETFVPGEPSWFLDVVGVDPGRQGGGIGGMLVQHGVDLARTHGIPAFLETGSSRNVPYYERFGFRVAQEADAPDDGPHVWFMRLDP